jgi:GDPmannose 4,6-dehydratase
MGNVDAKRDWGHAKDYVEAMWLMLQAETPEDFVIATGEARTVREFLIAAFSEAGITIEFKGEGVDEKGFVTACLHDDYDVQVGQEVICIDPVYFRPTEVELLIGDPTKANTKLGWKPKYSFDELVKDMIHADLELFRNQKQLKVLSKISVSK